MPVPGKMLALFRSLFLLIVCLCSRLAAQQSESLELGQPVEKALAGGATHTYRVTAAAGQFLRVIVEQRGIDVSVALLDPAGQKLHEVDSPNGDQSAESASLIVATAGDYRVEVRSGDAKAAAGHYSIRLEALRAPTAADRNRIAAEHLTVEADTLGDERDPAKRRQAIQKYTEALKLWRELNDRQAVADVLMQIGTLHAFINESRPAVEAFKQAQPLLRALQDQRREATAFNNIGQNYLNLGDPRAARENFNQALPLWRALKDQRSEAVTLNGIGESYNRLGEKRKALDYFEQALKLRRAVRDSAGEAVTLNSLGVAALDLGDMQRALDAFNQALPLRRDPAGRALTLIQIGRALDLLGAPQEALTYFNQALPLTRSANAKRTESQTLNFIGLAHWAAGNHQEALAALNENLPLKRELKDAAGEAATLNNLGLVQQSLGEHATALDFFNQALPLARTVGDRQAEARILNNIGFAQAALGDKGKALETQQSALALARDVRDRTREARIRFGIARLERDRNRLKQAREQIEETIKIVESIRAKVTDPDQRAGFRAATQQYYDLNIDILMRLHQRQPRNRFNAEALHLSERARARTLIELLIEAGADIRQGVAAELLARERELQDQINDKSAEQINTLRGQPAPAKLAEITARLTQLTADLSAVQNRIRTESPQYAALTQPEPLTAADIQRRVLDRDSLLLEYALSAEHSYLWAVTPTSLQSYRLPPRAQIEAAARRFYDLIGARNHGPDGENPQQKLTRLRNADAEVREAGTVLSRMLLGPVAAQLGRKRLLIAADGALHFVPFAALPELRLQSAPPLIVGHEIVGLPSATTLAVLRAQTAGRAAAPKTVAVLADPVFETADERVRVVNIPARPANPAPPQATAPDAARVLLRKSAKDAGAAENDLSIPRLPFTRAEAETILSLAAPGTTRAAFDFAANRAAATDDELSQYRYVHFATHGFLNSLNPELSGLVLSLVDEKGASQPGYLLAPEVYNLKLPAADLVVLSACQTGLGKEVRGEGLVGLTRGFMYAGAPRVAVSLWSVNDRATSELMQSLYRGLLTQQLRPAAALRAAQVALWKQPKWRAPYYWAAFTLLGEWR